MSLSTAPENYAGFLRMAAEDFGYDEQTIATALRCLPLCGHRPAFGVTQEAITLTTAARVRIVLRRRGRECHFYEALPRTDRCMYALAEGRCARREMDVCPVWQRIQADATKA